MRADQVQALTIPDVREEIFPHPSGNVRGIVTTFIEHRKKSVRIGHCSLFTDRAPQITITVPKSLDLDEVGKVTLALDAFAEAIHRLDSTRKA